MSWHDLEVGAKKLGFEVRIGSPDGKGKLSAEEGWRRIGRYEAGSGLWVKPVTEAARQMDNRAVAGLLAECDCFVIQEQEYDLEYAQISQPFRAAATNPEIGCMVT